MPFYSSSIRMADDTAAISRLTSNGFSRNPPKSLFAIRPTVAFVVAAGEQNRDVGSNGTQKIERLFAIHHRHREVENQKRDESALFLVRELLRRPADAQDSIRNHHRCVGRDHVDVIGFNRHVHVYLHNRHAGIVAEEVSENTLMMRIEVLHQNESHPGVSRQIPKQLRKRFQSAGEERDGRDGPKSQINWRRTG